jgi:DNA-binding SARP family transcriptional activator
MAATEQNGPDGTPRHPHDGAYRSAVHVQLLGPLEVIRDGDRIPLGGPKQRLVLAHLLIRANEVVSADLLIDEIWGDEPPDAARQSLQSYVSHLRKALGPDRLEGRAPGYIVHASGDEIDAAAFEALVGQARRRSSADPVSAARGFRQALALWHGEPLADLAAELSMQPEIERLTEIRLSAHEDLIDVELALGRHVELVPELDRLAGR